MSETGTFTIPEQTRGTCTVCGKPAYHHMSTKCAEHREIRDAANTGAPRIIADTPDGPRIRVERPTAVTPPKPARKDNAETDKAARADELERSIMADLNPVLLQGFAMICKPIDSANFFVLDHGELTITPIGEQIVISEGEAKILAKAAAELEASPIGTMATAAIGPVLPVLYAVAALGVIGFHGYKVMGIRSELLTQYNRQVQAQAENTAGTYTPDPEQASEDGFAREADTSGMGRTSPPNGSAPNLDFTAA